MDLDDLTAIFRGLPEATMIVTADGRLLEGNEAAGRLLGFPQAALRERPLAEVIAPSGGEDLEEVLRRFARSRSLQPARLRSAASEAPQEVQGEGALVLAPTEARPAVLVVRLRSRQSALAGFVALNDQIEALHREIGRRQLAEEALRRNEQHLEHLVAERTARLQEALQDLESFSYSVSHDLRAPLRRLDSLLTLLWDELGEAQSPSASALIAHARVDIKRLTQLIEDLLDLGRAGRSLVQQVEVDLSALAHAITAELRAHSPERRVEVHIAPDLRAQGDPDLLRIALMNLLGNAWKYTSHQPLAHIAFGSRLIEGTGPVFFVQDDGAGFEMDLVGRLFQPFERLHNADEFPGSGIGLVTVKRILTHHDGRIWAEGAVGEGATFYFTLNEGSGRPLSPAAG